MTKTFKIGDKVRCLSVAEGQFSRGTIYTVREHTRGGYVMVERDDRGSRTNGWVSSNFKLVSSPRTIARDLALTPMAKVLMLHLERHKSISPVEAKAVYGYPKIARQIWELRQDGIDIRTELRKDPRGQRYARYSLAA